jgi:hypothetical protein
MLSRRSLRRERTKRNGTSPYGRIRIVRTRMWWSGRERRSQSDGASGVVIADGLLCFLRHRHIGNPMVDHWDALVADESIGKALGDLSRAPALNQ